MKVYSFSVFDPSSLYSKKTFFFIPLSLFVFRFWFTVFLTYGQFFNFLSNRDTSMVLYNLF